MKQRFRKISVERLEEFLVRSYARREFFPHSIYVLPKCGPDAFRLGEMMCGEKSADHHWEVVLYAEPPVLEDFPAELFFDDDLVWHQQQFGKTGQIATANLIWRGDELYSFVHISDVVQRVSRRRDFKSRLENRFKGWTAMLLNGIMSFAVQADVKTVHMPRAGFARCHTDPAREVKSELFDRVYDQAVLKHWQAREHRDWWRLDVATNQKIIVEPVILSTDIPSRKTICICHDIERGLGHEEVDQERVTRANGHFSHALAQMLRVEANAGIRATYNVVGCLLEGVRTQIEAGGHEVAFHSFDHRIENRQLARCRRVDYRLKGYRPPQSVLTDELRGDGLNYHNFEWLASSAWSLGYEAPLLRRRLVNIPIHYDDFDMYNSGLSYKEWEGRALEIIAQNTFASICLHDCYADFWLENYASLLDRVQELGEIRTMTQVANEHFLSGSI